MYYAILAQNYLKDSEILKSYIKKLREDLKKNKNSEDVKWRISLLYVMYLELKHTAEYLEKKNISGVIISGD